MYKIKRKRTWHVFGFILAFFAIAAIGLGIGYAGARLSDRPEHTEYIINSPEPLPAPTNAAPPESKAVLNLVETEAKETTLPKELFMYLIKLEDGKTKVYNLSSGEKVFSHSLPIEPNSLRNEDLAMLKEGIYLKTKNELLSFTEDFCS